MPMPTDRKGRFLFFKARAQRRARRAYANWPFQSVGSFARKTGLTKRAYVTSGLGKQAARKYPLPWDWWHFPALWSPLYRVAPLPTIPPVIEYTYQPLPWQNPEAHPEVAILGFVHKRVRHWPKLRVLARRPYIVPLASVPETGFYPLDRYPSGQWSHAKLAGYLDD